MSFNFPDSPTIGQVFTTGTMQYRWNGYGWETVGGNNSVVLVSDTPPANPVSGQFWWESDSGALWIYYQDANSAQWVEADKGGVNGATSSVVMDAMAYNGMQVNGSMEVSQERGTVSTAAHGTYVLDNWMLAAPGTLAAVTGAQSAISTTLFPGFQNYILLSVTTAAAPATGDIIQFIHRIEGYRIVRLAWGTANAQPITICFWTRHVVPGTYSVNIRNNDSSRVYIASYTQNVANASEYKTITVPGCTDGTWLTTNGIGITLGFVFAAGTAQITSTPNVWLSSIIYAAPGQVNAASALSNFCRITGVVILPGTQAPTAAQSPLIMRPFDQELLTCKRYWERQYVSINAYGLAGQEVLMMIPFLAEKRAIPTGTIINWGFTSNVQSASNVIAEIKTTDAVFSLRPNATGHVIMQTTQTTFDARL